jgi:hypothetical protein
VVPIFLSQFATDIPLTVRRAATHVLCLAQDHAKELDALSEVYGETFAAQVQAWRRFQPPVRWTRAALQEAECASSSARIP